MAEALGWPETPIGCADILALATNPEGWAAHGHPEWGPFRLGKTNPNFSTSGLSALIAQYYAATGKTDGPHPRGPRTTRRSTTFATGVESAVVHYGDITLTFLNNLYRADRRGTALTYVSAVAVEEKSVIDYNKGNPDGILDPGEEPRPPRVPLVAIYPKEGTLFSDNPLLRARRAVGRPTASGRARTRVRGVRAASPSNQRAGARVRLPAGQPGGAGGRPDRRRPTASTPTSPRRCSSVPEPPVLVELLDQWAEQRKAARVDAGDRRLGLDGRAGGRRPAATKLDLAKRGGARRASTSSGPTTRSACASSPRSSGRRRTRTSSTSCPSGGRRRGTTSSAARRP